MGGEGEGVCTVQGSCVRGKLEVRALTFSLCGWCKPEFLPCEPCASYTCHSGIKDEMLTRQTTTTQWSLQLTFPSLLLAAKWYFTTRYVKENKLMIVGDQSGWEKKHLTYEGRLNTKWATKPRRAAGFCFFLINKISSFLSWSNLMDSMWCFLLFLPLLYPHLMRPN